MKNEAFAPTPELLAKMDAWWRAANYLSACQMRNFPCRKR